MVSTKARHICTEGLTNKFQESCSEISPDLWWSMDPNKPWGVDSGNLSGSNVVFFISLILKSASMFQVRCHTSSHIFSPHLLVHVCVDDIKLLILFSLDAPFFTICFHLFPWPFSDLGNESSAPFLTPQQALRPRSDVDIRAVLDEQTHVPRGPWLGAFCKVAFSSEMI
jgi:hypothetical protein